MAGRIECIPQLLDIRLSTPHLFVPNAQVVDLNFELVLHAIDPRRLVLHVVCGAEGFSNCASRGGPVANPTLDGELGNWGIGELGN